VDSPKLKPRKRTGVLLLYPTKVQIAPKKAKLGLPTMGFSLTVPALSPFQRVAFRVKNTSNPEAVVVDAKSRKM
jgi:hypothetical protein